MINFHCSVKSEVILVIKVCTWLAAFKDIERAAAAVAAVTAAVVTVIMDFQG